MTAIVVGLLLVWLLVLVARAVGVGMPKAPPGMRAVRCARCNAVANVGTTERDCVCWRCGALGWFTDRDGLDITCPVCKAPPGYECHSRRGRPITYLHLARTIS